MWQAAVGERLEEFVRKVERGQEEEILANEERNSPEARNGEGKIMVRMRMVMRTKLAVKMLRMRVIAEAGRG